MFNNQGFGMNQNMNMNNGMGMGMNNGMNMDMNNMNNMNMMNGMNMNNGMGMNNMNMMNGMNMNNGMGMNNMNMFNMMGNNMQGQQQNMAGMAQGMLNNFQNNQMFQQNPQTPVQQNSNFINLHFRVGGQQLQQIQPQGEQAREIIVQCTLEEKLRDIVQKYRNKSLDNEEKKFVYNAKNLDLSLSAAEAGLIDNATIFVLNTKNVKGA